MTTVPAPTTDVGSNPLADFLVKHKYTFRRLHSLTGILFGGYLVFHLLINATLLEGGRGGVGPTVYQQQVDKIHGLPWLFALSWFAILLPIIYHTLYGILVIAAGRPNMGSYRYAKNWYYFLQRVSAIILIGFIAFHVLGFKGLLPGTLGENLTFVPRDYATESTIRHMQAAFWVGWIIYPLGILAATFHLANGFWAGGITWGLTVSRKGQNRWGAVCIGIFLVTTACGFGALGATLLADKPVIPVEQDRDAYLEKYDAVGD
ncbi:MAG: hypothetical protein ACFCVE_13325 [Phycisphaerae bacterium]